MNFKILVVDDEKDLRDLITYFLKKEHYEVMTAENGKDGFEKIQSWKPNLVISDIRMPVWDGFELIKQMSQNSESGAPIMFISGYVGGSEEELKNNPLCAGFIPKPVNKKELLSLVKEFETSH
ncbi:MAG: response regulator [Bdellovibrio sp.]|nr:response regulator [Bdellovibrio sp.]